VKVRIHDFRHSFSARLISNGRSLFELQSILGRNDPKVTVCYAHLSAKARQEAANAGSVMVPRANLKVA
jgi:site-specific recombinase XerD